MPTYYDTTLFFYETEKEKVHMRYEFKLPDIGEGLHEAEIVRWFIQEGDEVARN
ncbi:Dihydrolipoamide acyltransferase component [Parageobacillus toebii]|uniref:Dihydrolipoamide acyltransferase component n=1 Tax=Parageobacillus toebii TaxID=153151 RepID=A0A150N8G8_9BACL|nr:Dihydrolipoamide acyltransferase component [Parageobacillus toebii]